MIGQLIDILCDDESIQLAKITGMDTPSGTYAVQYMTPLNKRRNGERVYGYENAIDRISPDNISGYYDSADEKVAGFNFVDGVGFIKMLDGDYEEDSDFSMNTDSDDDESEDESLIDSDEDEDC